MVDPDHGVVDSFAVLGLGPDADEAEVRRAFRALARQTHPDRGGDVAQFQRVNQAYEALRTPERRALVARAVREQRRPGPSPARPGPTARPARRAATGPTDGGEPPPSRARRLAEQEQDRLVQEFFRSHPAAGRPAAGSPPGAGAPRPAASRGHRGHRGRGGRGALVVAVAAVTAAAVAVVVLLPDLLPGPLGEWVQVVTG